MKHRVLMLSAFCILISNVIQAQSTNMSLTDFYKEFKSFNWGRMFDEKNEIQGSPYESNEFVPGEIITISKLHYTEIPLRFNIFNNQVEFKNPDGNILSIGFPEMIDSVLIGKDLYIYYPIKTLPKMQYSYLKVLTDKSPTLLQKLNVFLKEAEPAGAYKEAVLAKFERRPDDFYLVTFPGEAKKIDNKKDILENLSGKSSEIEEFIKKNKTKFNKAEDLVQLMEYYYSL
jgi:hypothetical protein